MPPASSQSSSSSTSSRLSRLNQHQGSSRFHSRPSISSITSTTPDPSPASAKKLDPEFQAFQLRKRRNLIAVFFFSIFGVILVKLFITQVINGSELSAQAETQYLRSYRLSGSRGRIYTSDGALIVGNEPAYQLFLDKNVLQENLGLSKSVIDQTKLALAYDSLASDLAPLIESQYPLLTTEDVQASLSAKLHQANEKRRIINLATQVDGATKTLVENTLQNRALGFDQYEVRAYPEASFAAQIVGHVAKNDDGEDLGYYGIEGELDRELRGRLTQRRVEVDSLNQPISLQNDLTTQGANGRDVYLTIRRDIQYYLENTLAEALARYGARKGEIIVMEPHTGQILGWATLPSYSPKHYQIFEPDYRRNPSISDQFEPGSIFKFVTMASGIDSGAVSEHTVCPNCGGPLEIGKWTITNWNNKYHPGINMTEALEESDNTALTFVAQTMGAQTFQKYLDRFMIGQAIDLDMQEDHSPGLPQQWGPVELANRSFGQGITVNSMQMMRAIGAIANEGKMMRPQIVAKVKDTLTGEEFISEPYVEGQPITAQTAQTMTSMLKSASSHGEAKWIMGKSDLIAGKTGTAQIPDPEHGGYKSDETMATFIGFAPADNPQFSMIVKLENPRASQWAAETAAPLWFELAERLFILLGVEID